MATAAPRRTRMVRGCRPGLFAAMLVLPALFCPSPVRAADEAIVATLEGDVRVDGRVAGIGEPVPVGATVETGQDGRVRILWAQSVLVVAPDSAIRLATRSAGDVERLRAQLKRGRLRAITDPEGLLQVQTPSTLVDAPDSEVILSHLEDRKITAVVVAEGAATVYGGHPPVDVTVRSSQTTLVVRGERPSSARPVSGPDLARARAGLDFPGGGAPESFTVGHPLLAGELVPAADRAGALPSPAADTSQAPSAPELVPLASGRAPGTELLDEPDVGTLLHQPPGAVLNR